MKDEAFKELLTELAKSKLVKVTGSYADGTQNECSDIDFYVKADNPEWRFLEQERNIVKVKKILDKFGIQMQSDMTGYWYSHKSDNNLPIEIEFSDLFQHRKNRLPEVEIMGVKFKTY